MPTTSNGPVSAQDTGLQYVASDDIISTESAADKNVEVRPDFFSMDEEGNLEYAKELTNYLRKRGAVVRGPKEMTVEAEEPAKDSKKKATAQQGPDTDAEETVYEWFYEWEYDPKQPVTIRFVAGDRLDALRGCLNEAFHRRYEV